MNAGEDPTARHLATLLLVAGLAGASAFGGVVHGSILSDYEARQFFYLTSPEGPAANYRASRIRARGCAPGSPDGKSCRELLATLAEE